VLTSVVSGVAQVSVLMTKVIQDERVRAGLVVVVQELVQDPGVYEAAVALVNRVLAEESVRVSVNQLLIDSSHKVR
jgi:hypothetical protein